MSKNSNVNIKYWLKYPKKLLRDAAQSRKLISSGTKKQLAERLALDDNNRFKQTWNAIVGR